MNSGSSAWTGSSTANFAAAAVCYRAKRGRGTGKETDLVQRYMQWTVQTDRVKG